MTVRGTTVTIQLWSWKTLVVMTSPQTHFAKSFLNSLSRSPARPQESSLRSFSVNVAGRLTGRALTGIGACISRKSEKSCERLNRREVRKTHRFPCGWAWRRRLYCCVVDTEPAMERAHQLLWIRGILDRDKAILEVILHHKGYLRCSKRI